MGLYDCGGDKLQGSVHRAERPFPRESEPLAMAHSKGGRLPCRAAPWCCSLGTELVVASPAGAVLWSLSDQVPELWEEISRLHSIGKVGSSLPSDVNLQNQYNA